MFDADRPIESRDQDRLNRTVFAKYLARSILDHNEPESLVIGLYGSWGVGKTSILNLMIEELNFAASNIEDAEKPILLNFSPWSYSGQNQLIYNFFRRLSSALRMSTPTENTLRIIHLLELYVSFFTQKPIPRPFRSKRSWWQRLTLQGRDDIYGWKSGRDLTIVKQELNELLLRDNRKIIIMIDNISRLYPKEIKQIFQIVKSMGNYVNTTYVLAFEKEHIVHALDEVDGGGGNALVEKVVQLPFTIPPILQQDLEAIFADRLKDVLLLIPEDAWNNEYWADLYYGSLKYFFENCRDITRYVNTLRFSYSRLRDVVNPADFFALTAIEVFMPDVYFGIRDNKDLFTDLFNQVYVLDEEEAKNEKIRCDEIMARTSRVAQPILLNLLMHLFPRIRKVYQPHVEFFHSDIIARKLRRICSPDLFDVYFRLSMQAPQILPTEFNTILTLANDPYIFDQALARLNQDDRIIKFLDQLDSNILKKVPRPFAQTIINALLDNGDLFPQGTNNPLSLDTPMRIHRITHELLQRFKNSAERFAILQNAISQATKSIYILVHELIEQGREHNEALDTYLPINFRDLSPDELVSLQQLTVTRIKSWAESERLISHPHLLAILFAWRDWSGEDKACQHFVTTVTKTDRGLLYFLAAVLQKPIDEAMTEYVKNPTWDVCLDNIAAFIAPEELIPHAQQLFEAEAFEKLNERDQLALMIFLDLMKANTRKVIPQTTVV